MAQEYSTLEVYRPEASPLPEAVPGQFYDPKFADAKQPPRYSSLPQVIDSTPPEVYYTQGSTLPPPAPNDQSEQDRTVCGLKRKTFWIVFAVLLVIIIAAAVGGGVGGALSSKKKSSPPSSTNSTTTTSDPILPNSRIAAINYTDASNVVHHRVYFQGASLALYQSDFSAATNNWTVSRVNVTGNVTALQGTALSAYAYYHSAADVDFHLYFMDASDGTSVREFYSTLSNSTWTLGDGDARHVARQNSTLASYGRACSACSSSNFYIYEGPDGDGTADAAFRNTGASSWPSTEFLTGVVEGSAIATAPVPPVAGNANAQVAVYWNNGQLREMYYNGSAWVYTGGPSGTELDAGSGIAALTQNVDDVLFVQVLTTSNAVTMDMWNGSAVEWSSRSAGLGAFDDVVVRSPIAANQLGMIYMWMDAGNGSTLAEWKMTNDGTDVSFEKVGPVGLEM
ncbi:hypothetical protein DBV05_g6866 [Lasiodiplodia theobromae]|uniref:Fucose-specific lectin n=1 Tax=Lasiodiplodia theobromae TaxID=45133 RepID=A0A5N5D9Z9_9PEZI|nr:hypothetical protein DBV05_g6866 [Lasiodiplodia theobromae]